MMGTDVRGFLEGQATSEFGADLRHPVEQVSWEDCGRELSRLGLALPTEAQWEYGARAGTTSVYWTGNSARSMEGAGNIADSFGAANGFPKSWSYEAWLDDGYTVHAPVGMYRANAFGLHDVIGNEWEWCRDGYWTCGVEFSQDTGERHAPGARFRVYRGGGFYSTAVDTRSARRASGTPAYRDNSLGVRPSRRIED